MNKAITQQARTRSIADRCPTRRRARCGRRSRQPAPMGSAVRARHTARQAPLDHQPQRRRGLHPRARRPRARHRRPARRRPAHAWRLYTVLPNGHGSEYLFTLSSPRRQRRQPSATRWRSSTTNSMPSASSANAIARRQQPLPAPLAEPRGFRRAEARSGYGASTSLDHGATSYLSWVLIHEEGLGPFAERLLTRL